MRTISDSWHFIWRSLNYKIPEKFKRGFTLIELLVVIAIIVILSTISAVIYTSIRQRAENSKRLTDLNSISTALEANYDNQTGEYHTPAGTNFASGTIPRPPEGGEYNILFNEDFRGFRVCASLTGEQDSCLAPSDTCVCRDSVQGRYVALVNPPPPPPPSPGPTFPIGVGIDSSNVSWWNERALSTDLLLGTATTLNTISSAIGTRVLFTNLTDPESGMVTAQTNGWMVTANIECSQIDIVIGGGTCSDGTNVAYGEISQYQMANDRTKNNRDLIFIFGPTGRHLEDYWDYTYSGQDHALLRNSDIMIYQTQRYQDYSIYSDVTQYASAIKDYISKFKSGSYIAQNKVWVQVSVNPPGNRCMSAQRVIEYIDSIFDGSANSPDALNIFYSPGIYDPGTSTNCSEKRVDVMKQVVENYRP